MKERDRRETGVKVLLGKDRVLASSAVRLIPMTIEFMIASMAVFQRAAQVCSWAAGLAFGLPHDCLGALPDQGEIEYPPGVYAWGVGWEKERKSTLALYTGPN